MPFIQRQVSPIFLAKGDSQGVDSLADGNINVLNNIIHQLSDLSDHATDIINNITVQCENINLRTDAIVNRVKNVASKINDIPTDVKVDASIIDDPIRGFDKLEGQLFTSNTRPTTMSELYDNADGLPNFDLLQPYRDDDKINKTFYSNPNYFLELWKKQFEEAALAERQKRKEQRRARKEARKENLKPKRHVHVFTKIRTRADILREKERKKGNLHQHHQKQMARTLSTDFNNLPLPERDSVVVADIVKEKNVDPSLVRQSTINPIMEENDTNEFDSLPVPVEEKAQIQTSSSSVPPPPPGPGPVPPPPPGPGPLPVYNDNKQQQKTNNASFLDQVKDGVQLRKAEPVPKAVDTRSGLLEQIRAGRELKKVQKNNDNIVKKRASGIAGTFEDVMKDRRFAMESDSEDDTDSDDDLDWDQ